MAKTRMINTRFWNDSFIAALSPLDRYLFLYLLTNEHTNIAGVYELPLRTIVAETGLGKAMLPKMLGRLSGKVYYLDGWVYLKNFQKHQSTTSDTVRRGIEVEMAKVPPEIRKKMEGVEGMDTLSGPIIYLNPNLNSNSNENAVHRSQSYLLNIPEEDIRDWCERFDVYPSQVKKKGESLSLWCDSEGRKKKNYRAFLLNAIRKDFPERPPKKEEPSLEKKPLTPEQRAALDEITQSMKVKP